MRRHTPSSHPRPTPSQTMGRWTLPPRGPSVHGLPRWATRLLTGVMGLLLVVGMAKFGLDTIAASAAPGDKETASPAAGACGDNDVVVVGEVQFCTHGPDPAPEGVDASEAVEPVLGAGEAPAAVACEGDGVSGPRVEVIYAHAANVTDRYTTYLASFRQWAADADRVYRNSAAATGGSRAIRFVTTPPSSGSCAVVVRNVTLTVTGDDSFVNTANELYGQGFNRTDRKYMIFVDSTAICGQGGIRDDYRRDNQNLNNFGPTYGRTDAGCWGDGQTPAHELGHNLGSVQHNALNSSRGYHCVDEWDAMCYSDIPYYPTMRYDCLPEGTHDFLLDCNHDDYFHTNPPAGSYLDQFWNTASNRFLIGATDRPMMGAPANDNVEQAIQMRARPFKDVRNVAYATKPTSDPASTCTAGRGGSGINSVWYKTTPSAAGTLAVNTVGSDFDTMITVYRGTSGAFTEVACSDDVGTNLLASVSVPVTAGTTYHVMVTGWAYQTPYTLRVNATGPGEGVVTTPKLVLDKTKSKFNGVVKATATGFAPDRTVTLSWPREYEYVGDPYDGAMLDYLISGHTDATGQATLYFRTPLEPLGDYEITALDAEGATATATLRVIPRILLNETSGGPSTRLRVYFYGFAPGERIEVRWHTGSTTGSSSRVLTTLTVADNGRASKIIAIPGSQSAGKHLIVGKVVGVSRSASTTFNLTSPSPGQSSPTPVATRTAVATATAVPTETATPTPAPSETPLPTETATAEPVPTETPTPTINASPIAAAGDDRTVVDADASGAEEVVLDGSASMDPEGGALAFSWSVGGVEVGTGPAPSVTVAVGTTTVVLTVTDEAGATASDEVDITVEAPPPDDEAPAE